MHYSSAPLAWARQSLLISRFKNSVARLPSNKKITDHKSVAKEILNFLDSHTLSPNNMQVQIQVLCSGLFFLFTSQSNRLNAVYTE